MSDVLIESADIAIPIRVLTAQAWPAFAKKASPLTREVAEQSDFKAKAGQIVVVPGTGSAPGQVLFGLGEASDPVLFRALPGKLPARDYQIDGAAGDPARKPAAAASRWSSTPRRRSAS